MAPVVTIREVDRREEYHKHVDQNQHSAFGISRLPTELYFCDVGLCPRDQKSGSPKQDSKQHVSGLAGCRATKLSEPRSSSRFFRSPYVG
jgi:hypothetical protein